MILEEAEAILSNCQGYIGDYLIYPWMIEKGGIEHTANITLDGGFTLSELEALVVVMKADIAKVNK